MKKTPVSLWCLMLGLVAGCDTDATNIGRWERIWGRRGISDGRLQRPRAIAIDQHDQIYLVDKTARIQVFDTEGNFLRTWRTPAKETGKPTGLSIGVDGSVLVADTHYYRLLVYSPDGKRRILTIGGTLGHGPGKLGLVTDAVQDSRGNYYVAEKGEYDRIQKFSPGGKLLWLYGERGPGDGELDCPISVAVGEDGAIYVSDWGNNRIQKLAAPSSS